MMYSKPDPADDDDIPTVDLTDPTGRILTCYLEYQVDLDGQVYGLLLPIDHPIEIFTWLDEEEDEPVLVDDPEELARVLPIAKAVLAEQNLNLKDSAITLTVEGDLPDLEDEGEDEDEDEDGDIEEEEGVEAQLLVNFFCEDQEYGVFTPLDPMFIPARLDEKGQPSLLPPDELQRVQPVLISMLEDQIFE